MFLIKKSNCFKYPSSFKNYLKKFLDNVHARRYNKI